MALIDIEYGTLASSETMNKNFSYLDNKISETAESIMTSISSILSNIATINSRLSDLSEGVDDSVEEMSSKLEEYKAKTKLLIGKTSMVPNWSACSEISLTEAYTVPSNGYLLLAPEAGAKGDITVNGYSLPFKTMASGYAYSTQLIAMPVLQDDVVQCKAALSISYFMPTADVSLEDF